MLEKGTISINISPLQGKKVVMKMIYVVNGGYLNVNVF